MGASPREMKLMIMNAAQSPKYQCLSPFAVFDELEDLVRGVTVYEFLKQEPLPGGFHENRKFISALIVPEFGKLEAYAQENGIPYRDRADLCAKEEVREFMLAEVNRATPDLASYERIKKVALLDRDFDIESGEVTPTLKVKRSFVEKKYRSLIDSLYE